MQHSPRNWVPQIPVMFHVEHSRQEQPASTSFGTPKCLKCSTWNISVFIAEGKKSRMLLEKIAEVFHVEHSQFTHITTCITMRT
jgi:hypothetical protein